MAATRWFGRAEALLVLVLLAAAPFLLTGWVHGDGIGYVAPLRSVVVGHDLDLADEFAHLTTHIRADAVGLPARFMDRSAATPGLDPVYQTPRPDPVTGRLPAYYAVGPAIAWAPGYVVAHLVTRATRGAAAADGYGGLYALAIALGSLAFGLAGAWCALRLARVAAPEHEAWWAVLAIAWATPFVYYLYFAPDYGHALSTLTSGAFFVAWWTRRGRDDAATWFGWGALAGALFLVRWNDVALAFPALAVEAFALARRRGIGVLATRALACAAGLVLVASPQFAAWQVFHGRPWVRYPEAYVGLPVHGFVATLFSSRHGLFVWTPVTLLAVAGLAGLARRERMLAFVALASLAMLVVGNCTARDWWGGASFGMRRLVSGTPLFALGLAALLADARRAWPRLVPVLAPAVALAFATWNALLVGQYVLGMIDHSAAVPFATLVRNQPHVIARALALVGGAR